MRTMMRGKHGKKSSFPALAALALCAVLIVTFMPNLMFSANAEDEKQEISGWKNLPSIEVKAGTTKEEVVNKLNKEYPQLKAEFLDSFGDVLEGKMVDVVWQDSKDYSSTAGTQAHFSATVKDTSKYTMSNTPSGTVRVVKEVESEAGASSKHVDAVHFTVDKPDNLNGTYYIYVTNNADVTAKGGGVFHTLFPLGEHTVANLKGQDGTKSISSLDSVYIYLLKQKQGSSYGENTEYDQNNFQYIESGELAESDLNATYTHQISLSDSSNANINIRIASSHSNIVTDSEITSKLGNALKYGIFTKELKSLSADTECTVAAKQVPETIKDCSNLGLSENNWSHLYSNISVGENKLTVRIHGDVIKKVKLVELAPYDSTQSAVAPDKASTLLKRSLLKRNAAADMNGKNVNSNESGKNVQDVQNGCAVFENVQPGSYKITGYDEDGQVIDVKRKTITNASSGDPWWKYDINTNYFGHISDALLGQLLDTKLRAPATLIANGNTYKKSADKQYTEQTGVAENKQIDFEASFNNLSALSTELANAKSTDNVKVYYETPETLRENSRSFTDSDKGWTIINVDLTHEGTSYRLPGQYNDASKNQMDGASYDNAHSRIIWNFYTSNGTTSSPYTGTISMGGTLCGIMLAPCASVSGASGDLGGCIAAASYDHTTGEVHQRNSTFSSSPIDQNLEETLSNKAVKVTKEWKDDKDDDKYLKYRPASISVTIIGKTTPENQSKGTTITKDIKETDDWRQTVDDLPRTDADGNEYTYTVKENLDEKTLANYKPSDPVLTGSNDNGVPTYSFIITNTFKTIDISGTKTWDDSGNQDGKRPSSITVKLLKNKEQIDLKTVSAADGWNYKFEKLPENDTNGNKITYSVAEADVPGGYTSKVTGDAKTGFTITNTHTPETTSVSGTKTWDDNGNQDGKRPDSITVRLWGNNKDVATKTVTANDNWTYNFTNLPKYDNGKEITYTITEDAVADYSTKIDGYKITNSYTPGKTSVTVTKAWEDNSNADKNRPASIQVQLYANGEKSGKPVSLSELTKWTYTWSDLDAKNSGTDIKYTVKEVNTPDGYTSSVSGNAEKGFIITNAENTTPPTPVTPQPTYTTYTVHKVWDLNSGETVPDSVPMQLYKNGVAYGSPVTVTKDGWTYTWTGLPQTENGKLNTWSVKEVDPDNQYTATVVNGTSSATVTNRSNNNAGGKTQVSVHKVWKLDNGRTAASSVQAQLYRNGEAYGDPVTLSAGNSWSHVWTGLTKTDAQGNTISWTVREVNVPSGFTSTVTGTDRSFTITNDDKPKDNHNKHNNSEHPNNHNNNKNNKPVHPSNHNKNNTTVHPGTPTIPKNTGKTVANRGITAGSTPRTGDQTSLGFWLAMLIAGAAGTAAALLFKRRKRKEEE